MGGVLAVSAWLTPPLGSLENYDLRRRPALDWGRRAPGSRWSYDWRSVPRLCEADARAGAPARRRGSHGQPRRAQDHRCARGAPGSRCKCALPAALLARPEPHRAALRQVEDDAQVSRGPHQGRSLGHLRSSARRVPRSRVSELPRPLRLRVHLNRIRSRAIAPRVTTRVQAPKALTMSETLPSGPW